MLIALAAAGTVGVALPGCSVGDDFTRALGDPLEARLAAALNYRDTQTCPASTGIGSPGAAKTAMNATVDGLMHKSPWLANRILKK